MLDPLLIEILAVMKGLKVHALESLGPFAPVATGVGYLMVAGVVFMLLVAGRGFWSPPTPELKQFPARIAGAIIAIAVLAIFLWMKADRSAGVLLLAGQLIVAGSIGAVIYLFLRLAFGFRCEHHPQVHVKGLWLTKNAKKRMNGEKTGHSAYDVPGDPPANTRAFYCGSWVTDPYFVWSQTSQAAAQVLLFVVYLFFIVPLTVSVASGSMALMQLDVRETAKDIHIDLPTDVLFEFDQATLRPAAVNVLQRAADLIRERKVAAVKIYGHTDGRGKPDYNIKLSYQRAEAVRDWLAGEGKLGQVAFRVEGFGATQPVAPNANADGSDNPEGRQQNRRVTIVLEK